MTPVANDLDRFRARLRAWAETHAPPPGWRDELTSEREHVEVERRWMRTLLEGGYGGPHWSRAWGGADLSLPEQVVLHEELTRVGAPYLRTWFVALHHTYATLTAYGSPEQQRRHLPPILRGETIWCQGFSEPEAGSDLASLRTRAVREGDDYVVDGRKVWSSGALQSDWCLLLARTDAAVPKHQGISYFLLDMKSPGVEVRTIRQADGGAHFCEIFLDGVRIPAANLVGAENAGWAVARATLTAERGPTMLELAERLETAFGWLVELARAQRIGGHPAIEDEAVRESLARLHCDVTILGDLCRRVVEVLVRGGGSAPEASIVKVYYSELLQRVADLGVELSGAEGQVVATKPIGMVWESGVWMLDYVGSWGMVSGGGTNHIQRNVLAERILGLPREPGAA